MLTHLDPYCLREALLGFLDGLSDTLGPFLAVVGMLAGRRKPRCRWAAEIDGEPAR